MNNIKITIETKLNNAIFKCEFEDCFYNIKHTKAYQIFITTGLTPHPKGGYIANVQPFIICEACYKKNKDQKGLRFEDPSKIVASKVSLPKKIK